MPELEDRIHLTVLVKGIVVPAWVAVGVMLCFILAVVGLIFMWQGTTQTAREIRVLQLHMQDTENVLIRSRTGTRNDFAPWDEDLRAPGKEKGEK